MKFEGATAVVTGAGSGIGRAICVALARRSCHLALVDIDEDGMAATADLVARDGLRVSRHRVDVAERKQVSSCPASVTAEHPRVELLVNNAGVALGGTFEQLSDEDIDWLLSVNLSGVLNMTRAFLPLLKAAGAARIVNMSSVFGFVAPPEHTIYAASKFAVRGFSQALAHELRGSGVGVTVVHPAGVRTAIARNARAPKHATPDETARRIAEVHRILRMPAEVAGERIVRGIERDRRRILVGRDAHVAWLIERLFPVSTWDVIDRIRPKS